jgi:GntR family transcriptional regulator
VTEALHVQIAESIRQQIRSGELPVGAALPSEARLREQWRSSRGPVRQALAALRAEGVIAGGAGKPPVVCTNSVSQPFDTLLSYSSWVRSLERTAGQRTLELTLCPADEEVAARLEVEVGRPVVRALRLRLLDGEPAMLERGTYIEPVGRLLFDFDCDSGSIWAYLQSRGVQFATASHVIDAVPADAVDAHNLEVAEGAPLLRQRRTARDADRRVIEFHDDRYLPEVISFTLENTLDTRTALMRNATP